MKYTKRVKALAIDNHEGEDEEVSLLPDVQVHESGANPTGILDIDGNELLREPNAIGFIWNR